MLRNPINFGEPGSQVRRNRTRLVLVGGFVVAAAFFFGLKAGSGPGDAPAYEPVSLVSKVPKDLSPRMLAGQRFVAGFNGTSVPKAIRKAIASGRLGGVILFADNLPNRSVARSLTRQIHRVKRPDGLRRYPLPIMIDQEGGLVKRLAGAPTVSAEVMGSRGPGFSKKQGRLTGLNLKNAGINVNLAPVLDVARPGGNIASDDCAFGSTVKSVSRTAIPFARAMQASGVAATAKHFPGLGDVSLNTDDAVQRVNLSRAALRKVDQAPYRPFIKSGGELVMVGTAIYPAYSGRPAAFTKNIVTGELRRRLGFGGVTITDSLETVASRAFGASPRVSLAAAKAGMDMLLFATLGEAMKGENAVADQLRRGKLDRRDFRRSVGRILKMRGGLPG